MLTKRTNPTANCLLKFDSDESGTFSGYAAKFNGTDSYNDTILPGAFSESLKSGDAIRMFWNHNSGDVPIGDWVEAKEDDVGLFVTGQLDFKHHMGESVYSAMKRGAVDGLSIGFKLSNKDYDLKEDIEDDCPFWYGNRNIHNMKLMEVSPVNFPADDAAKISDVKSDVQGFKTLKDYEHYLRDVNGWSGRMAKAFVSQLIATYRDVPEYQQAAQAQEVAKFSGEALSNMRGALLARTFE